MASKLKALLEKANKKFNELLENTKEDREYIKDSYKEMEQKFRAWKDEEFKKFNDALKQEEVSYCMKHRAEICSSHEEVLVSEVATETQDSGLPA